MQRNRFSVSLIDQFSVKCYSRGSSIWWESDWHLPASPLRAFSTATPFSSSCLCFTSTCSNWRWIIWDDIHKNKYTSFKRQINKHASKHVTHTCALCSLRSSSCLACRRAALCTRRVSFAFSSSSVPALWNSVVDKLMLEGSGNTTQTPTTSDGHDDSGVAALVGRSGITLCFYWGTRCWGFLIQPMGLRVEEAQHV